jgi:sigma-E factor negative regulatory protein RseC
MTMLETRAIVVRIDGQRALVRADQGNGCEQCDGKGCGAGKLSGLFCSKPRQFQVDNPINAGIDDEVIISVAEGAILHGVGMVYLLPLLLLAIGAALGNQWAVQAGQHDAYAAVGALSGLAAGFVFAKWILLRQARSRFQPYIARLWREEQEAAGRQGTKG